MTDEQIIKILEYCTTDGWCSNCPHEKKCIEDEITQLALDLINRQKAVIERQATIIDRQKDELELLDIEHKVIRAKAVREFSYQLRAKRGSYDDGYYFFHEDEIYNLVKEMVGES
jgi:hypothetical protein